MISEKIFGVLESGEEVKAFTIECGSLKAVFLEYGCVVQSLELTLANGEKRDIMLGYDNLQGYVNDTTGQGAFIGRYANRITGARFELNGREYKLCENDGPNHLHGLFAKKLFKGSVNTSSVVFTAKSPDGEDGFPGNMELTVKYALSESGELSIDYFASTDEDTLINLTNHSYFNLDGQSAGKVYNHTLWLNSKNFCEADDKTCATGKILSVENTPMDFTSAKEIGKEIDCGYNQLTMATGYDHNFIIDKPQNEMALCAMVKSSDKSVIMEVYTTQPGIQLYSANYLNVSGKGGAKYTPRDALCLETQHYPCTPSNPHFPSVVLKKGEQFHEATIYKVYSC